MAATKKDPGSNRLRPSKSKPSRSTKSTGEPTYGMGIKRKPYSRY
jgi:hypothetical protein